VVPGRRTDGPAGRGAAGPGEVTIATLRRRGAGAGWPRRVTWVTLPPLRSRADVVASVPW